MRKVTIFYDDVKVNGEKDFHASCSLDFFGTKEPPQLEYSLEQMSELEKDIVERSVSVPGVQPN